jgi:hypothetical protein
LLSADREGGDLRSAALAGPTDAPQVYGWAVPRRRPSERDHEIAVAFAEERDVVRVRGSHSHHQHEASITARIESDALSTLTLPVRWHEGCDERPLRRANSTTTMSGSPIWGGAVGGNAGDAHVFEAVGPSRVRRPSTPANQPAFRIGALRRSKSACVYA